MSHYLSPGHVLNLLLKLEREHGIDLVESDLSHPLPRPILALAEGVDVPGFASWEMPECNSGRERPEERDPGCSLKCCRHQVPAQDFTPCAGTRNRRVRIFLEREYARLVGDE